MHIAEGSETPGSRKINWHRLWRSIQRGWKKVTGLWTAHATRYRDDDAYRSKVSVVIAAARSAAARASPRVSFVVEALHWVHDVAVRLFGGAADAVAPRRLATV